MITHPFHGLPVPNSLVALRTHPVFGDLDSTRLVIRYLFFHLELLGLQKIFDHAILVPVAIAFPDVLFKEGKEPLDRCAEW